MFDPYDPINPLGQNSVPYELQGTQQSAFDPGFQQKLRQASDQVLRRAEEQAMLDDPMVYEEINSELQQRRMRRAEPVGPPVTEPNFVDTATEQHTTNLSASEKTAILLQILSTTVLPLDIVDKGDYDSKCKYCSSTVRPFSEGPHHEDDCDRHTALLKYDTETAHRFKCQHCDARPFVAGFHHQSDCPRGLPAIPTWDVENYDYNSKCKYCSSTVRPFSEGPHHEEDCDRHTAVPLFHTERAHRKRCRDCEARPFTAGPHHKIDCTRHKGNIAIPVALLSE